MPDPYTIGEQMTDFCDDCGTEAQTLSYHSKLILDATDRSKSEGLGEKVELCLECYEMMVIKEQIEYWKSHIREESNRSL
tara:strand:+ start:7165 stop:7404 length:240 start_codon:yes stop_codon:yes gene_type:complete